MPAVAEPRRGRTGPSARRGAPPSRKGAAPAPKSTSRAPARRPKAPANRTATTADARRRAARPAPSGSKRLPGWGDLDAGAPSPARPRRRAAIDAMPSLRLAAWALVACVGLTLYVGHVYATRSTLEALQDARRENLRLHLTRERLRSTFDGMTGPAQILPRAATLGLEEGVAFAPPITLEPAN